MKLISKEELDRFIEFARKAEEDVRELSAIAREELLSMNDAKFVNTVCNTSDMMLSEAKDGDVVYQCGYANREYFNRVNTGRARVGDRADIYVTIVGVMKAAIPCPRAGTDLCKLRDFTYETNAYKQKVKDF
jgi:hypothetical protein